jgi:heterodisulfide reductase subunit B
MKRGSDVYVCDQGCGDTITREEAEKHKYKNLKEVLTDKQFNDMLSTNGSQHKRKAKLVHFIWNYATDEHIDKICEVVKINL